MITMLNTFIFHFLRNIELLKLEVNNVDEKVNCLNILYTLINYG